MQHRLTIKEFAQKLNVSTATISRAFTPDSRIHPETRVRVLEQAKTLGYSPNPNARSLAQKRSRLIGLDYPGNADVLDDLYLVKLAKGVQAAARHAGYGMLLNTVSHPEGATETLREWVFGHAVDGVILIASPGFSAEALRPLAVRDVPCVLVTQGASAQNDVVPTVLLDLSEGVRAASTHLLRLGHTRIGFLTSTPKDTAYEVYAGLMQAAGLFDPTLVQETGMTIGDGRSSMHRLLAAPRRPTAVLARTDVLAFGAMHAAREMGLQIPQDISLVGHDDIVLAELTDPPLTTVRVDTERIGCLATELLLDALNEPDSHSAPFAIERVTTELVVRSTTAPVA